MASLLLVDDSDAVLEFERATLSRHYRTVVARNGREALARVAEGRPDAILLDLSMPELDGDQVLEALQADPVTASIPVIIVSSEGERARSCLSRGAVAALEKPVRSEQLIDAVGAALAAAARAEAARTTSFLPVVAGSIALAVPLRLVDRVTWMAKTVALPGGPAYLSRAVEVEGAPVAILEVARRFGCCPAASPVDQRLVLITLPQGRLALNVDEVHSPEEATPEQTWPAGALDAGANVLETSAVKAVVRLESGRLVPLIDPAALLGRGLLARLGAL